jgi:Uma2 family endonuclease
MTAQDMIATSPHRHLLSVDDFLLLDASGAFQNYAKSELIEGEIYTVNAQHSRHGRIKLDLAVAIGAMLRELGLKLVVHSEVTVKIEPSSLPQPDVLVTSYFGDDLVPAEAVLLVAEIADTTQKNDFGPKVALYAKAHILEYWVFDTKAAILHQMWAPKGDAYTQIRQIPAGQMITAETIDGLTIRLPA